MVMDLQIGDYLNLAYIFYFFTISAVHEFGGFFLLVHKSTGTISIFEMAFFSYSILFFCYVVMDFEDRGLFIICTYFFLLHY